MGGWGGPGINLVARLAQALGMISHDLLPEAAPADTTGLLRERVRDLFDALLAAADRETLLMLNPLPVRLAWAAARPLPRVTGGTGRRRAYLAARASEPTGYSPPTARSA